MRKGSNINFNSAGFGSSVLLLLLAFLMIQPMTALPAYAEEDEGLDETAAESAIAPFALAHSTVGIQLVTDNSDATVTPIDGNGEVATMNVKATVSVTKSKTYSVFVGSESDQLAGNDEYFIEPISGEVAGTNAIPANHWGYSFAPGETASETYKAMPTNLRGTAEYKPATDINGDETKVFTLKFAAKFDSSIPAGSYTNDVTVSVVSTPQTVTNGFGIATMQEMTEDICQAAENGTQAQLQDVRDGKYYWVGKIKSDTSNNYRCWMTQNLDFDLFDDVELKGDTTNLSGGASATWKPAQTTTTDGSTIHSGNNGQWSWSMGGPIVKPADYATTKPTDYYTTNSDSADGCGSGVTNMANCSQESQGAWVKMDVPLEADGTNAENAHRLLGNLYQWCAVTAGCVNSSNSSQTGSSFTSGEAASSICPYGWKLPTSNTNGDFQKLSNALGATSGTNTTGTVKLLTDSPFYAVRGGYFSQGNARFYRVGYSGAYWSSTAYSTTNAYDLYFSSTGDIHPSNDDNRQYGFSVRCINDPTK